MFYAIYLLGIIIWILMGVGGGSGNLVNYMDGLKAFGRAFLFAFGKRGGLTVSYKESLLAVRMVMAVSAIFGFLGFLIGTSASIRSIKDFSTVESLGWIVRDLSVSMISLLYPLLIWSILLPLCFILRKKVLSSKIKLF